MYAQATLLRGENIENIYKTYQEELKKFPTTDWSRLKYNETLLEISNSNYIDQGVLNNILKDLGLRVAVPGDDFKGDILRLIHGRYYTNFNAGVVQKDKPSYEKNNGLWRKVIELAEENRGNVQYPFMIQGFYILPDKTEKNYGVKIVSASNFKIIEDDRLSVKYSGWKFDTIDELSLPDKNNLNRFKGSRTIYTREDGLSDFFLGSEGILFARGDNLVSSGDTGRIISVKNN
jgi:hypothetical protein